MALCIILLAQYYSYQIKKKETKKHSKGAVWISIVPNLETLPFDKDGVRLASLPNFLRLCDCWLSIPTKKNCFFSCDPVYCRCYYFRPVPSNYGTRHRSASRYTVLVARDFLLPFLSIWWRRSSIANEFERKTVFVTSVHLGARRNQSSSRHIKHGFPIRFPFV